MINTTLARLEQLQQWIAQGWQIEQPVLQRTVLHGAEGRCCALEVVVRRADERRVIALSDERTVQHWLEDRQLRVINI